MDPINIIAGLNLIATLGANLSGAKKGLKSTVTQAKERPKTYLQKLPLTLATIILISFILGIFQIGTLEYTGEYTALRIAGLAVYIIFSWVQVWTYKSMGDSYSQEIIIFKNHRLVKKGLYKYIRHPQYLAQILLDLGAGFAVLSFLVISLALIEIPFVIMRAKVEEEMLGRHFKEEYKNYKKKSGFFIPFTG